MKDKIEKKTIMDTPLANTNHLLTTEKDLFRFIAVKLMSTFDLKDNLQIEFTHIRENSKQRLLTVSFTSLDGYVDLIFLGGMNYGIDIPPRIICDLKEKTIRYELTFERIQTVYISVPQPKRKRSDMDIGGQDAD